MCDDYTIYHTLRSVSFLVFGVDFLARKEIVETIKFPW